MMKTRFITLVNIILDRAAVPEFQQDDATPEILAARVAELFEDKNAAAAQTEALNEFGRLLGEGEEAPSLRAARVLLDFIKN